MAERLSVDVEAYTHQIQTRPCFICQIVARNPEYAHHMIYEDEQAIVFLNKYPLLYGYTLVCPKQHREQVTADFSLEEYLRLQSLVYRVAEAIRKVVPTERMYLLSLGSQQGNRHVHWHVAPLPPGIPFEQQQLEALHLGKGVLPLPEEKMASLAHQIAEQMTMLATPERGGVAMLLSDTGERR